MTVRTLRDLPRVERTLRALPRVERRPRLRPFGGSGRVRGVSGSGRVAGGSAAGRRGRVVVVLSLSAVVLATADLRGHASVLRAAGAAVAGPAEQVLAAVTAPARALSGDDQVRVQELERNNARLAAELWAERAARAREAGRDRLQAAHPRMTLVTAGVVAVRGDVVTIGAGTRDGVRPDLAVVTADGLVGRVVEAGPDVATVLLLTAPHASVGVRVAGPNPIGTATGRGGDRSGQAGTATGRSGDRSGQIGTVTGRRGDRLLSLRLLDADAPLRPGQRVVTLGSSGGSPYPPGIPVGTVERVDPVRDQLTRTALVRPAVAFSTLDVLGVITDAD
ncbi:rod shape-determining protein MreC [Nonomuraea sp. FMUSA5-5]|uniref:Cell shape-determining protein MreC n=1 Tax=Nonomuraea composti TaxID=2720023 RepID=A0ABX1AY68_9ACTN|nr:rod shape-determining protein MreC [Nonomuraea sp. FMUSA5-5]NJP88516.1 rod shape-determining protein MreC [Nonomuraea sp. FMUSA5-5]